MIDVIKATEIMRKYCPETKLEIKNGADGLYLTESDIIWIGRDWHLGGLLHEITHAMLYKEDGRTGHDGVFADRLTRLVGEVFCDHIVETTEKVDHISQQEKKVSLTEQWKNGELEEGDYFYVKTKMGNIFTDCIDYDRPHWDGFKNDVEEVLAPVPSYDEYSRLEWYAGCGPDRIVELNKENRQLRKWCEEFNALDVAKENAKLKELLKECRCYLINDYDIEDKIRLCEMIDEVLK